MDDLCPYEQVSLRTTKHTKDSYADALTLQEQLGLSRTGAAA
jgi:hypothetical protein